MSTQHTHASPFSNGTDTSDFSSVFLSSEFTALLASNEPPAENQAERLRKLYVEKRTELDELLVSCGPATAFLPEKQELEELVDNLRTVLHPLRRLPLELLHEIFTLVVGEWNVGPGTHSTDFVPELAMMMAPWKLALVSRRWRSVALSSARLWSTIVINWFFDDMSVPAEFFPIHLERSGSSPLNVCLVVSRLEVEDGIHWQQALFQTCERWRKLGLDLGFAGLSSSGLVGIKSRLVSLESVFINAPRSGAKPTDLFESAPMLRFVAGGGDALNSCSFPWAQIESYHETAVIEDDWNPDFLRQMVSIQACKMSLFGGDGYPSTPIQWQYLSQLCLRIVQDNWTTSLNDFIGRLGLPQLTHLTLCPDNESLHLFSRFSTVQHLCIFNCFSGWGVTLSEDLITSCTESMQGLKSLCIHSSRVSADGALLQAVRSVNWLPSLEALYIEPDEPDKILGARPSLSIHFDIPIATYLDHFSFVFNAEFPEGGRRDWLFSAE